MRPTRRGEHVRGPRLRADVAKRHDGYVFGESTQLEKGHAAFNAVEEAAPVGRTGAVDREDIFQFLLESFLLCCDNEVYVQPFFFLFALLTAPGLSSTIRRPCEVWRRQRVRADRTAYSRQGHGRCGAENSSGDQVRAGEGGTILSSRD